MPKIEVDRSQVPANVASEAFKWSFPPPGVTVAEYASFKEECQVNVPSASLQDRIDIRKKEYAQQVKTKKLPLITYFSFSVFGGRGFCFAARYGDDVFDAASLLCCSYISAR